MATSNITEYGAKCYIVEPWTGKRSRRKTLSKYPTLEWKNVRQIAKAEPGKFASGRDTVAEAQAERTQNVTLKEVYDPYLESRKELKPRTITDYNYVQAIAFKDWQKKRITSITSDMVERRHKQLGAKSHAQANHAMRVPRALFNFAAGRHEDADGKPLITRNPVKRLSATKAWYKINRHRTDIKQHELKDWYQAVIRLHGDRSAHRADVLRDCLLLLLFTGLRRNEAARLCFEDIDFKAQTLTLADTKDKEPHTLPLSDYLHEMLTERRAAITGDDVFSGKTEGGHIQEPRKQIRKVTNESGVQFTLHDPRRKFITIAESLDIPAHTLKQLLNHKDKADVTAGYIVINVNGCANQCRNLPTSF